MGAADLYIHRSARDLPCVHIHACFFGVSTSLLRTHTERERQKQQQDKSIYSKRRALACFDCFLFVWHPGIRNRLQPRQPSDPTAKQGRGCTERANQPGAKSMLGPRKGERGSSPFMAQSIDFATGRGRAVFESRKLPQTLEPNRRRKG